ncbi:MAG TPA: hypothetical protein PLU22_03960 [Polyangiaceae bacterium]|nr:hypothetical protein [Polyangiaceae bacterium]
MLLAIGSIALGLVILAVGGDLLVRGATRLATLAGVSSLVIGLTVVAYGTSAPELIVSSYAALQGKSDIAVGNVVGSNVFTSSSSWGSAASWPRSSPRRSSSGGICRCWPW